jgi:DNA-binding NarL/FixJ family response regulator
MKMMRLLLVDDHDLFRESLAHLLAEEADFEVVAHCSSIEQAIPLLEKESVDIVLLDFDLGAERAPDFLERTRDFPIQPRVLLVTAGIAAADTAALLDSGAAGVFLKHSSPDLLMEAIRRIQAGETWIDQRCIRELAKAVVRPEPRTGDRNLTERERQVLRGVFEGRSNKEIGAALGISESSVKATLQQLFQKTGVRTRSQLVRIALEKFASKWNDG